MLDSAGKLAEDLARLLEIMAAEGIRNAATGISSLVGVTLTPAEAQVRLVPVAQIPILLGGPECEAVGIYQQVVGAFSGQIMIVIPYSRALEMVDRLFDAPAGTTLELGRLERSALAEVGNMTGSFFLTAIADASGLEVRPSPPAVMVDMVGAILDVILAMAPVLGENVLVLAASFLDAGQEVRASFWMIPDRRTLETAAKRIFS
jgi:chemotaxis protein CheC